MAHLLPPLLGKRVASRDKTFLSSLMGRSGVQQSSRYLLMNGIEKPMGACAWCIEQAFAVAALARCASSVNGSATAKPRQVSVLLPASIGCRFCSSGGTGADNQWMQAAVRSLSAA